MKTMQAMISDRSVRRAAESLPTTPQAETSPDETLADDRARAHITAKLCGYVSATLFLVAVSSWLLEQTTAWRLGLSALAWVSLLYLSFGFIEWCRMPRAAENADARRHNRNAAQGNQELSSRHNQARILTHDLPVPLVVAPRRRLVLQRRRRDIVLGEWRV